MINKTRLPNEHKIPAWLFVDIHQYLMEQAKTSLTALRLYEEIDNIYSRIMRRVAYTRMIDAARAQNKDDERIYREIYEEIKQGSKPWR